MAMDLWYKHMSVFEESIKYSLNDMTQTEFPVAFYIPICVVVVHGGGVAAAADIAITIAIAIATVVNSENQATDNEQQQENPITFKSTICFIQHGYAKAAQ